jgi:large subunit ribosomal protein L30
MSAKIKITYVRSVIKRSGIQHRILEALGLHKMNHSVVHYDTPQIRGMINKVTHMVRTEPVND